MEDMNDPWKKVKSGRFSQLLRDRISERRRKGAGSPLVVETGFPTSIVDLFVKNKDKLKNPLLKKKKKIKNDPRTSIKINMSGNDCNYDMNDVQSLPPPPPPPFGGGGVVVEDNVVVVDDRSGGEKEYVSGNMVSVSVLRLFLVVILALGTKIFVVGITFSAFVLLFVEYLVKQQLIRLPCKESKKLINLMVKKIMGFMRIPKGNAEESILESKPAMEMQIEQVKVMMMSNEIQSEKEKIDDCEGKIKVLYIRDIISAEDGEDLRTRKSRRAKMRVKMSGFLPKRLRKKITQNVDYGGDDVASISEEDDQRELSSYGGSSLSSISRGVDELVELSINQNEGETTQHIQHSSSSSSYLVALVVVVLLGLLVGGRGFALILTVSWCLLLKSGGAIGRRCIKTSILRSPDNVIHCN